MPPRPSGESADRPESSPLWPLVLILGEIASRVARQGATAGSSRTDPDATAKTTGDAELPLPRLLGTRGSSGEVQP